MLVVDDNEDVLEMMVVMLTVAGHNITAAHEGPEALEAARTRPDVVLLDVGLPGLDGLEVARRLRADPDLRDPFLVALTGYEQQSDRVRTREAGLDYHLVKPIDFDTLFGILDDPARRGA